MDDLKEKLKQAFAIGKNRNFKGTGNRLGTAEESATRPDTRFNARADLTSGRAGAGPSTSAGPPPPSRPSAAAAPSTSRAAAPPPAAPLPDGPAAAALARHAAGPPGSRPRTTTPQAPKPTSAPLPATGPSDEEIERISIALTLLLSCDNSDLACATLHKILSNIVNHPAEAKYRTLRLSNPKIQEAVVASPGGLDLLAAVGFHLHMQEGNEGFAALQPGADLLPLRVALKYLSDNTASTSQPSTSTSQPSTSSASAMPLPQPQAPAPPAPLALQGDPQPSTSGNPPPAPAAPEPTPPTPPPPAATAEPVAAPPAVPTPSAPAAAAPSSSSEPAPAAAAPPAAAEAPAAPQAVAGPSAAPSASMRETKVLMPVHPDTEVPDWFFERTAAEVKVEYLQMTKRNEAARQLQTRAQRELAQLRAGGAKRPRGPQPASVRVRTPEGVCIQATFQPQEPLTAVFEWVTGALRRPDLQYELVGPTRRPLAVAGRVGEADLAPSALLNLHVVGGGADMGGEPVLADGVLAQAQLAWGGGDAE